MRLLIVGLVALLVVAVAGPLLWWHWRQGRILHFHCPGCMHRLRYKAKSAGHQGMCPECGEKFTFPGGTS